MAEYMYGSYKRADEIREYWEKQRRNEVLKIYIQMLYGYIPDSIELICAEEAVLQTGKIHFVKKIILGTKGFQMRLNLHLPTLEKRYPVILYLCLKGQQEDFVPTELLMNGGFVNLYPQTQSHIFYKLRKGNHDMELSDWDEILRISKKIGS